MGNHIALTKRKNSTTLKPAGEEDPHQEQQQQQEPPPQEPPSLPPEYYIKPEEELEEFCERNKLFDTYQNVRRYLYTRCRYPAFTRQYIEENVDKPDTPPEELQCFLENGATNRVGKALIVVFVYLSYAFKNLYVPYNTFRKIDFENPENNVRVLSQRNVSSSTYESGGGGGDVVEIVRQVTCMATNCSHLSPLPSSSEGMLEAHSYFSRTRGVVSETNYRLAKDMARLPHFKFCHPTLGSIYSPVALLDSLGVFIFLCIAFNAFLLGSWCTIQQLIIPAGNEMIMFITAPLVTVRMARRRACELLLDMGTSYTNFSLNSKIRFFTQSPNDYQRLSYLAGSHVHTNQSSGGMSVGAALATARLDFSGWAPLGATSGHHQAVMAHHQANKSGVRKRGAESTGSSNQSKQQQSINEGEKLGSTTSFAELLELPKPRSAEEVESIARGCLPIIRTGWWRQMSAKMYIKIVIVIGCQIFSFSAFLFAYIEWALRDKKQLFNAFAGEMRAQNCTIWQAQEAGEILQEGNLSGSQRILDVENLSIKWGVLTRLEGSLFNLMPAIGITLLGAYYWTVVSETEIWLAELRSFLVASLVVARHKFSRTSNGTMGGTARHLHDHLDPYELEHMRPYNHNHHRQHNQHHHYKSNSSSTSCSSQASLAWDSPTCTTTSLSSSRSSSAQLYSSAYSTTMISNHRHQVHDSHHAGTSTRIETRHFYNIDSMRKMFLQETKFFYTIYVSAINVCYLRPNGELVHHEKPSFHAINAKINDKVRELKFTQMIRSGRADLRKQQQQQHTTDHRWQVINEIDKERDTSFQWHSNSLHRHDGHDDTIKDEDPGGIKLKSFDGSRLMTIGHQQHGPMMSASVVRANGENDHNYEDDDLTEDIVTFEQVYVNFRLFIEHLRKLTPSMGVVLAMSYMLNYGVVCIAVICTRKMPDLHTEPLSIIVVFLVISSCLIVFAANFHANAKKLQPLLWSIIAQLSLSQDSRLRHLRFLWLKQVQILDSEGGLALEALKLRVTYVNMIQLIIWTVTIIVLTLKS